MGYGLWGVNVTENESYGPKSGQRRLTSMSVIDSIFEMNNGIGSGYEPVKESTKWGVPPNTLTGSNQCLQRLASCQSMPSTGAIKNILCCKTSVKMAAMGTSRQIKTITATGFI